MIKFLLPCILVIVLISLVLFNKGIASVVILVAVTTALMWWLTKNDIKFHSDSSIKRNSGTDDDGEVTNNNSSYDLPTSIIAGPIKNYQDNTWSLENMTMKATIIPNSLDISGDDQDLVGFTL